ncbi:ankyrin [Anaeromyces robustus]|uniref:Ankyrin n=1 Tax=Anaeromyces robustus TaxID=1754192 RepID=A0A1Y1WWJ7_9FUNG|nr:ankyrin [Anaeromyces robustus]|eukprot:ORX77504.1 ankyrin [Anaeromyces robustus]
MLSRNDYNSNSKQQQQQQQLQPNYNEEYYTPVRRIPSSNIKRNKSFKSILKKFQSATIHGNFEKVRYYVESYGLLNETEHSLHGGRTCLMLSISRNNYEIIDYFCQNENIDLDVIDNNGDTALHIACSLGDMRIIELLINKGCNPFIRNHCGCTPLFNVVYYGFDVVCDEMLSLYQEKFGFAKTLEYINTQDNEEKTALMYGAMEGKKSYNCVLVLIKWNADTELLDSHGWNAFTYASYHGNFETCQVLLSNNKNMDDPSASEELVFNVVNNDDYDNNISQNTNRINHDITNQNPQNFVNNKPIQYNQDQLQNLQFQQQQMQEENIRNSQNGKFKKHKRSKSKRYPSKSKSRRSKSDNKVDEFPSFNDTINKNSNNITNNDIFNNNDNDKYSILHNRSNYDFYLKRPSQIDPYYYSNNINDSYFDDFPDPEDNETCNPPVNSLNYIPGNEEHSQYYYDGNNNCFINPNNYNKDITDIDGEGYINNDQLNQKIYNYNNFEQQYALTPINQGRLRAKFNKFKWKKNDKNFDYNYNNINEELPEQWKSVYEDYQHTKTAFKLHHWSGFTQCMTCWIPNFILKKFGKEDKSVILAWREKFTLCLLIFFISLILFLINMGLFSFLCNREETWDAIRIHNFHGANSINPWIYIRGQIYDISYIYNPDTKLIRSSYIPGDPTEKLRYQNIIKTYLGNDLSYLVPPNVSNYEMASKCKRWPTSTSHHMWCDTKNSIVGGINYCHNSNNTRHYLGLMKTSYYFSYTYDDVERLNKKNENHLIILRNKIYNMTSYFEQSEQYLGDNETKYLLDRKGYDISYYVHRLKKSDDFFMIGKLASQSEGCLVSYIIMIL